MFKETIAESLGSILGSMFVEKLTNRNKKEEKEQEEEKDKNPKATQKS